MFLAKKRLILGQYCYNIILYTFFYNGGGFKWKD